MIKILCFLTGCMALLVLVCGTAVAWDSPLEVTINYIKFNHTTGSSTNDALDLKKYYSTTIVAPEWVGPDSIQAFAYIMNQSSRTIKAQFSHEDEHEDINTMHIQATYTGSNPIGNVPLTEVNFGYTQQSDETTFTTSGTVPNSVRDYSYYWHWTVNKVNGVTQSPGISIGNTYHFCYSLLRQPSTDVFSDGKPWSIILEKACSWAYGENTDVGVATEIAKSIYAICDGYVDEQQYGTSEGSIDVEDFFDAIDQSNVIFSCYDSANIFNSFTEAVGCTTTCCFIQKSGYDFQTNPIKIVGSDESSTEYWANHKYGMIGINAYDPILKYNDSGNWIVPTNKRQDLYYYDVFYSLGIGQTDYSHVTPY